MYNCDKLARGDDGGIIKRGTVSSTAIKMLKTNNNTQPVYNRANHEFCNPKKYSVLNELEPDRPIGTLYVSRKNVPTVDTIKQKNSPLVKAKKLTPPKRKGYK